MVKSGLPVIRGEDTVSLQRQVPVAAGSLMVIVGMTGTCAFAVLRPRQQLSFGELRAFLEEARMARQYFPERLEILAEMPRTASGKIQKFRLREMARAFTLTPLDPP